MSNRAALYLRSSKDRSDVSIDAQRRALQELAAAKGLVVLQEFSDAVESGKDEDRPAFQSLLRAFKKSDRGWEHILVLDTSRVARRRHIALIFEHECERAGIRIHFKNVPDTDPITGMLLKSILQAMDEWHSLTSRAKGLAGMAENVRQGWRAGGKAPRGYKLQYHSTGAMREGAPVLKSKLVPADEDAELVRNYLRGRAGGRPRGQLMRELALPWTDGSLNDMEWMALTYAGHTTWNTTNELTADGYTTGTKRKPRADWMVQRDTHPPLISDIEAEAILEQLESKRGVRVRATDRPFLLTGMLQTPEGQPWAGEWDTRMKAGLYRAGKGKRVSCRRIDTAVLQQLRQDLLGDEAVHHILLAMRDLVAEPVDQRKLASMESRIEVVTAKVGTLVDLITDAGEAERAAYRRSIAAHESERQGLISDLATMRQKANQCQAAQAFTEGDARRLLRLLFDSIDTTGDDVQKTKAALGGLVEKIVLESSLEHCHIHYRIGARRPDTGVNVATLRGFEPRYSP